MELKALALQLGLPETADEAAVNAKLAALKTAATRPRTSAGKTSSSSSSRSPPQSTAP